MEEQPISSIPNDVVEEWLDDIGTRSEETKRTYRACLRALERYACGHGLDIDDVQTEDIKAFKNELLSNHAPSTVTTYLNGIRSFYRWAENDAFPDAAYGVKGAGTSHGFRKDILSPEQAKRLLASIDVSAEQGCRDYALINLMIRTGLRDIEVARANIDDVHDSGGTLVLDIQGKGRSSKDEFVVLTENAWLPLSRYLSEFRSAARPNEALFASLSNRNHGGRLTKQSISRIVKRRLQAAGFDSPRLTAHSLRHTAVTFSLMGGASVEDAQAMARHADISTTMVYAHHVQRRQNAAERKIDRVLDNA